MILTLRELLVVIYIEKRALGQVTKYFAFSIR
jgi:hypothetical protein